MELNYIIFPQLKTKISLEVLLNGQLIYIPKLKKISEDSQIPMSPRSSRPHEMMARYPAQSLKATKNIAFEQRNNSPLSCRSPSQNSPRQSFRNIQNEASFTSLRAKQQDQSSCYQETLTNFAQLEKDMKNERNIQQKLNYENKTNSITQISTEEFSSLTETSTYNTPRNIKTSTSAFAAKKCQCNNKFQSISDIRNSSTSNASRSTISSSCSCNFTSEQRESDQKQKDTSKINGFIKSIFPFSLSDNTSPSISERVSPNNVEQNGVEQKIQQVDFSKSYQNYQQKYENKQIEQNQVKQKQTQATEQQLNNAEFMGYDINIYQPVGYVPVLYLTSQTESDNLLIYFHANGEDIFSSYPLLNHLRQTLEINIIGVEYPGYGSYKTTQNCTSDLIQEDAQYVFDFVTKQLKFELKNIILLGRSIGTGPATYLASKHEVGSLVLISAFTSIRGIVEDFASFFKYVIKERFNNLENIKNVKSPTFLLHGKKDSLISYKQSITLQQNCQNLCEINTPSEMNHSSFDYRDDLSIPLLNFLLKCKYPLGKRNVDRKPIPEGLTYHPSYIQMNNQI